MDQNETSCVKDLEWIQLSEDTIQFCDHVNMLTKLRYPQNMGNSVAVNNDSSPLCEYNLM
jgi:hypothetical protein